MNTVELIVKALLGRGEKEVTSKNASKFRKFTRTWQGRRMASGSLVRSDSSGPDGTFWFVSAKNGSLRVGQTSAGSRTVKSEVKGILIAEGAKKTAINYGINRKTQGGGMEHQNHKAEIQGAFNDSEFCDRVLRLVNEKHPGWMLTGFAPAEDAS